MVSGDFPAWFARELRLREWTPADFARASGFSPGMVSNWITGRRTPSPASIDRIADVLGADVDAVLTLAGHRPQVEPIDPDDPVERLVGKLRRLRHLESWKVETVEVMLDVWLRQQREGRLRAAEPAPPAYDAAPKR